MAWVITACVSLSFHPDPKFIDCTLRHNSLTMSQAFAFPVPIAWACFEALRIAAKNDILYSATSGRLNLGVAAASLWLAASSAFAPKFAFGYDLYSLPRKIAATTVHTATGMFALNISLRSASVSQIIRRLIYYLNLLIEIVHCMQQEVSGCSISPFFQLYHRSRSQRFPPFLVNDSLVRHQPSPY